MCLRGLIYPQTQVPVECSYQTHQQPMFYFMLLYLLISLQYEIVQILYTNFKTFDYGVDQDVDLTRSGTLYSLYVDGVLEDSITVASVNQAFTSLGRENPSFNGSLQSLEIYDVAVADVTNITETPVQTFTADPLKMRTSANLNPTDGQDVAKWYADEFSAYRDARVVFDTNDNMEGLPAFRRVILLMCLKALMFPTIIQVGFSCLTLVLHQILGLEVLIICL